MAKTSNKNVYKLPPHSIAKIKCYKKYLQIYLHVVANSPLSKVYLLDLFAGEGRDIDGEACSSVAAAEAIKHHYDFARFKCKGMTVFFNDEGNSVIEKGLKKIARVGKFVDEVGLPSCVEVKYLDENFETLAPKVVQRLDKIKGGERALCFIDPFGYKYSKPEIFKKLMANGKTEIILFMPICFMHRFAAKALRDDDYIAGKHIEDFVSELFDCEIPDITNQVNFIKSIQKQFRVYLSIPYVDVMFIEKSTNQFFALFFFSNSKRGFHKMLEAKWTVDEDNGHGFKVNSSSISNQLFQNIDHEDYTYKLLNEISRLGKMTNQEIFDFGLSNNHLPKHSNKVLNELKTNGKIKVLDGNGNISPSHYIDDNHKKTVYFTTI